MMSMKRIDRKQRETLNQLWKMENYIERFIREELNQRLHGEDTGIVLN